MHKAIFALWITIFLWSSGFVGIRLGLQSYDPIALGLLRYLISSLIILFPFLLMTKRAVVTLSDLLKFLFIGMIGFGIYNIAINYGEVSIDAGVASFINSQIPIMVLILASIFLREKISFKNLSGIVISFCGVFIIAYDQSQNVEWAIRGIIYLLIANLCAAIYTIGSKPLLQKYSPLELTAYTIWAGTLILSFHTPHLWQEVQKASNISTLAVCYLGIFPGLLGYLTWNYALKYLPATYASSYLYAMPLAATFLGWILLSESQSIITFLGGLIALSGVMIKDNPVEVHETEPARTEPRA